MALPHEGEASADLHLPNSAMSATGFSRLLTSAVCFLRCRQLASVLHVLFPYCSREQKRGPQRSQPRPGGGRWRSRDDDRGSGLLELSNAADSLNFFRSDRCQHPFVNRHKIVLVHLPNLEAMLSLLACCRWGAAFTMKTLAKPGTVVFCCCCCHCSPAHPKTP